MREVAPGVRSESLNPAFTMDKIISSRRMSNSRHFGFPSLAAILAALFFIPAAMGQAVRIMPLGDSITRGSNGTGDIPGGYRKQLALRLGGRGLAYDLVGSRTDNPAPGIDPNHNGVNGIRTDQVLANLPAWLSTSPNAALVHLGTNDLLQHVPISTAISNLGTIVQQITNHPARPRVFLATIIPIAATRDGHTQAEWASIVGAYNVQVRTLVQQQVSLGRKVTLVDMASRLNFTSDWSGTSFYHPYDGTHPSQTGYNQMGDLWFNVIMEDGSLYGTTPPIVPPPSGNLALGKASFASSSYAAQFGPQYGNDNNTATIWSASSSDGHASWTVDLAATYIIQRVDIVTRQDIDQPVVRRNFRVVGSNDRSFGSFSTLASQGSTTLPHASTFSATVTNTNPFRYIRVEKTDGGYLTISEVRLFGAAATPPGSGTNLLVNGSFESGYTGWLASGNQSNQSTSAYAGTNGARLLVFNGGNTAPNGVVSQTFSTRAGATYQVAFAMGVLAYTTNEMTFHVSATGAGALVAKSFSMRGGGNGAKTWANQSLTFVANSPSTTLTFRDHSSATLGIDVLLDHVQVIAQ
jgi:lysophospholipase L1-like esterase